LSKRDKITHTMSSQVNEMSAATTQTPATEVYEEEEYDYHDEEEYDYHDEEEYNYHENEPFYSCAYCNQDRGRGFMDQMCADCYWEHDSLRKRPGRMYRSLLDPKYQDPEEQQRVFRWIKEANEELEEFEEKLEAGQDRIHRELEIYRVYGEGGVSAASADNAAATAAHDEHPKPKSLKEMTDDEISAQLINIDEMRKQVRYEARDREMTPGEAAQYASLDRAAQACVDELLARRK